MQGGVGNLAVTGEPSLEKVLRLNEGFHNMPSDCGCARFHAHGPHSHHPVRGRVRPDGYLRSELDGETPFPCAALQTLSHSSDHVPS